jgi:hypothetical protein
LLRHRTALQAAGLIDANSVCRQQISGEEVMKKFLGLALLTSAFLSPGILAAADVVARFPSISPDAYTAKQKEFAKILADSPRAGNVNNPPFKVYFRSPEFAVEAIKMSVDYLTWPDA